MNNFLITRRETNNNKTNDQKISSNNLFGIETRRVLDVSEKKNEHPRPPNLTVVFFLFDLNRFF